MLYMKWIHELLLANIDRVSDGNAATDVVVVACRHKIDQTKSQNKNCCHLKLHVNRVFLSTQSSMDCLCEGMFEMF